MASKIKKTEWKVVYVITGIIDVFQILIDVFLTEAFGGPEVVNEFIDAGVGVGLFAYFHIRGVSMTKKPNRIISMLGMETLTDITGGLASFWILEVLYIHRTVRMEEAQKKQEEALQFNVRQPANVNGVRQPNTETGTSYGSYRSNDSGTTTSGSREHISTYNAGPLNVGGVRKVIKP